jgi:hypothetical protein
MLIYQWATTASGKGARALVKQILQELIGSAGQTVGSTGQIGLEGDLGDIVVALFFKLFFFRILLT